MSLFLHALPPYLNKLSSYLESEEVELWKWFSSDRYDQEHSDKLRLELLKNAYLLPETEKSSLYEQTRALAEKLEINFPVKLYQATQGGSGNNAALYYLPTEIHIVFFGRILEISNSDELESILAHELAHHYLWGLLERRYHITERLIEAMATDRRAEQAHIESARRYDLYTEIFADRMSLILTGNLSTTVSALVKVHTGLTEVSGGSYLKQASEILDGNSTSAEGDSHPELYIRAKALELGFAFVDGEEAKYLDVEDSIVGFVEGKNILENLDIIQQVEWGVWTEKFLQNLMDEPLLLSERGLGHAKLYFENFVDSDEVPTALSVLAEPLKANDVSFRRYAAYTLLDLVAVDAEKTREILPRSFMIANELGCLSEYEVIVRKELKLKKKDVEPWMPKES